MRKADTEQLTLAAHGIEVAREINRHNDPVSAQVYGYLRWYTDLSHSKGYEPLAALLKNCLTNEGGTKEQVLHWTKELAAERGKQPNEIRQNISAIIQEALEKNPDFASQILSGLYKKPNINSFLNHSVRWLKNHRLTLQWIAPEQSEAVWSETVRKEAQDFPYISLLDYQIVKRICLGEARTAIAQDYGCTTNEISGRYEKTLEIAQMIESMARIAPPLKPGASIEEYLNSIGFPSYNLNTELIAEAVRLLQKEPVRIKCLSKKVYAVVGRKFNMNPTTVGHNIRQAYRKASRKSKLTGQYTQFYKALDYGNANVKSFFTAFLLYMEEGNAHT